MARSRRTGKPKPAPRGRRLANMPSGRHALLTAAITAFAANSFDG